MNSLLYSNNSFKSTDESSSTEFYLLNKTFSKIAIAEILLDLLPTWKRISQYEILAWQGKQSLFVSSTGMVGSF